MHGYIVGLHSIKEKKKKVPYMTVISQDSIGIVQSTDYFVRIIRIMNSVLLGAICVRYFRHTDNDDPSITSVVEASH